MSPMLIIAKREFRSNFDSPLAYVVICLSYLVLGVFFFTVGATFWQVDRASVARLFELGFTLGKATEAPYPMSAQRILRQALAVSGTYPAVNRQITIVAGTHAA